MARSKRSKFVEEFSDSESEGPSEEIPEEPPTSIDPYAVLNVAQDATQDEIKHSYRKLALLHHPDKVAETDKESAKEAFQRLAFAYAILSDQTRRSRYDATGSTSDSILDAEGDDFDWLSFYRSQYENVITAERINAFKDEYKDGEEERADILTAYTKYKGGMDAIYARVMLSNVLDDDERFRSIIDEAIKNREVESFDQYTKETDKSKAARIKRAKNEAKDADVEKKRMQTEENDKGGKSKKGKENVDGLDNLAAMIKGRQQQREGFLAQVEAKYTGGSKKRRRMDEPPEEAFAANRGRGKKAKA